MSPNHLSSFHPLSPFSRLCLLAYVPCLMSLFLDFRLLCPLSHSFAPSLLSSVPSLTALLFVSWPLYSVYQLSQSPLFVAIVHCSCPLLLCFPQSLRECKFFLKIYMHTFDGWLRAGTVHVFCPLSHAFVLCLPSYVPCLRVGIMSIVCCQTTFSRTEEIKQRTHLNSFVPLSKEMTIPLCRRVSPSVVESPPVQMTLPLCRRVSPSVDEMDWSSCISPPQEPDLICGGDHSPETAPENQWKTGRSC